MVKVNTLEYIIADRNYRVHGSHPHRLYICSEIKRVLKRRDIDLTYSVISKKTANETNVYACSEGDPFPLIEKLLNKKYKAGWSVGLMDTVFYDHSIQSQVSSS